MVASLYIHALIANTESTNCNLPRCLRRRDFFGVRSRRREQHNRLLSQPNQWRRSHVHFEYRPRGNPTDSLLNRRRLHIHQIRQQPCHLDQQYPIPRSEGPLVRTNAIMGSSHILRARLRHRNLHIPQPEKLDPRLQFHPRRPPRSPIRVPKSSLHTNAHQRLHSRTLGSLQLRINRRNVHSSNQHQPRRSSRWKYKPVFPRLIQRNPFHHSRRRHAPYRLRKRQLRRPILL